MAGLLFYAYFCCMKILITGANGFLGHYLCGQLLEKGYPVLATGKGKCRLPYLGQPLFHYVEMDFTDTAAVIKVMDTNRPDCLVHAGAISKPDECELNKAYAEKVNIEGTRNLLEAAGKQHTPFIFISTDFIFDGKEGMYQEEDTGDPVNYYGLTKLKAEALVKQYSYEWSIVRTVLVYGKPLTGRSNILTVVKEKLEKGEEYNVVDDQVRTPTFVEDLAAGIVAIIERKATGIFHLSGKDVLTPYQMACKAADHLNLDKALLKKVTAAELSQAARRPLKTGFIINKARNELGYNPISFEEGLSKTFSDR
jgi:dTDP-4-dehydrorhamnose reductase